MGRARSAIAVRATEDALKTAVLAAMQATESETITQEDFDGVIDYCRPRSEELGGPEGSDAWYLWTVGDWAVLGDLSMQLVENIDALAEVSTELGEVVIAGIDAGFEYACFACAGDGEVKRLLVLEDEEIIDEGYPVKAEAGIHLQDFNEEEAERLWTSYGLPTFEYDLMGGPFTCIAVQRST